MNQTNLNNIEQDLMKFTASSLSEQWDSEMDSLFEGLNLEIASHKKQRAPKKSKPASVLAPVQSWMKKVGQKVANLQLKPLKLRPAHA